MKVLNWLNLQLNEEDLKAVIEDLKHPTKLRKILQRLVSVLLNQYPWTERNDTVELFHPSQHYEINQQVALPDFPLKGSWSIAQVTDVKKESNPKQGKFQVVRLKVKGEERLFAAGIPDARYLQFTLPTDDQQLQELVNHFVDAYENNLRQAVFQALEQFPILIYLPQTDEVVPCSFIAPLEDTDAGLVAQLFAQNRKGTRETGEIVSYLRSQGRLSNLSDEQATTAVKELLERNGYVLVSEDEWLSPDGIEIVDRSIQRRPPAPIIREDDEYYETVELPSEGKILAEEIGEEEEEEEQLSLDQWRERARTQPLKLPPLTFQNIMEAYFPLNRQLSEFLPPGSLRRVRLRFLAVDESDPMTFWVSRGERDKRGLKADKSEKERFRQWLISQGIPAGTTFWIERISDFEYRLFAKPLNPPRTVRQVKFASIENKELKFELEEVTQRWEGDPLIFKADMRFEDLDALHKEAHQVGLRIPTIVRRVFKQLDPNGQGLYWSEVFNATYLIRMCSPRTVIGVLYNQPCFESLGNGRFRLKPEVPLQIIRCQPVRRPAIDRFEPPTTIWANRSFVVKVQTKYCQQVTLEYSQDGQHWCVAQTSPANPEGQKTNKFQLSLPKPGQWELRVIATTVNDSTLTKSIKIQVQPEPVIQPITVQPPEVEEIITVNLPFTLPQILFPIPFASAPLSRNLIGKLAQLTGKQTQLSIFPQQADEMLQRCVAESGQFVTHRSVADFMVNLANPKPNESIADICCGSGIFLVKAWMFVKQVYGANAAIELFGADIRPIACEAARINLEVNGFANGQVIQEMDSLTDKIPEGSFDIVLGNPPFDLATVTSFLQKWINLLKEGGRMVVLVPAGILTGSQQRWIRERLVNEGTIMAIVSLPRLGDIYGAAGNVLFWAKKPPEPEHEPLLISIQSTQNLESELIEVLNFCFLEYVKQLILKHLSQNTEGLRTYQLARSLGLDETEIEQHLRDLAIYNQVRCSLDKDGFRRWVALG